MTDFLHAYQAICKCIKDLDAANILRQDGLGNIKIPTGFTGLAGEFYIMHRLEKLGLAPRLKGGKYDIELANGEKVEVRASVLKDEGLFKKPPISNWGWRLQQRKDRKLVPIAYDWVICVKFDNDLTNPRCFLLSAEDVEEMGETTYGRFSKVAKKLWLYKSLEEMQTAIAQHPKAVPEMERRFNKNQKQFLLENRWKKLTLK